MAPKQKAPPAPIALDPALAAKVKALLADKFSNGAVSVEVRAAILARLPTRPPPPSPQQTLQLSLADYLFKGDPSTGLAPALERCKWNRSKYRYKAAWHRDLSDLAAKDGMGDIKPSTIKTRISEQKVT